MFTINYIDKAFHWSEYTAPDIFVRMFQGRYTIENRNNSGFYYSWLPFQEMNTTPYIIETTMRWISGSKESWYGVIWGCRRITDFTFLQISCKGDSYRLCERHRGIFQYDGLWSEINIPILRNEKTEVEIAVDIDTRSSSILLERNNTYSQNYYSLSLGKGVGFICGPNCSLEIESLFISNNPGIRGFGRSDSFMKSQEPDLNRVGRKMIKFEAIWSDLQRDLKPGTIIRNWSILKGYFKSNMTIVNVQSNSINVETPTAVNLQVVPKKDFHIICDHWEGYKNHKILRRELSDLSRYTTYIISIFHWYEEKGIIQSM